MKSTYQHTERSYRWQITWRVLTAIFGGFALANTSGIVLTYLLPFSKVNALTTALLLSFAIYAGAVMWVFSHRSMTKALGGVWVPAMFLLVIILLFKSLGAAP